MLQNSELVVNGNSLLVGKATDTFDFDIAKRIAEFLQYHYAGFMWAVNVSSETQMIQIRNLSLSGEWGFNLHMTRVLNDTTGKLLRDAGGEILERYRVKRGAINHDKVEELPTDFAGRIIVDKSGAQYA